MKQKRWTIQETKLLEIYTLASYKQPIFNYRGNTHHILRFAKPRKSQWCPKPQTLLVSRRILQWQGKLNWSGPRGKNGTWVGLALSRSLTQSHGKDYFRAPWRYILEHFNKQPLNLLLSALLQANSMMRCLALRRQVQQFIRTEASLLNVPASFSPVTQ